MEKTKATTTTSDQGLKSYPPNFYRRLISGYATYTGDSESRVVVDAIKKFFDSMPTAEKERILNFSKNNY